MIVVDASAVAEVLLRSDASPPIEARILGSAQSVHAPHLLDVEILQVLRRCEGSGAMDADRAKAAVEILLALPIRRHPHVLLAPRIWALRHNLTAYDAAYVALAELLDAPLLTRDRRLAAAAGSLAKVELL